MCCTAPCPAAPSTRPSACPAACCGRGPWRPEGAGRSNRLGRRGKEVGQGVGSRRAGIGESG
ncbi:hypothetical protein B484DRAFT_117338 [Ochromonadaceae sp. CCMP2298]|nr:hypothetical protein B484DRAFT_117338 [Ochromonadaceae sp. CCMP2298]